MILRIRLLNPGISIVIEIVSFMTSARHSNKSDDEYDGNGDLKEVTDGDDPTRMASKRLLRSHKKSIDHLEFENPLLPDLPHRKPKARSPYQYPISIMGIDGKANDSSKRNSLDIYFDMRVGLRVWRGLLIIVLI